MQIITIAGNVGKDPVLRRNQGGDPILGFSVAVNNGKDVPPTWYDVSIFGKRAMTLDPLIGKGSRLTVNGRFSTREHEGKTYLQVNASEITLQGGSQQSGQQSRQSQQSRKQDEPQRQTGGGSFTQDMDDDIPFAPEWRG